MPERRLVRALTAFNTATASDNKIHDDAVAQRFGFTGGLVPGVDVYAYLTSAPVAAWGAAWLERGTMSCRFGSPTYDGDSVEVWAADGGDGSLAVEVVRHGEVLATATATLPDRPEVVDIERWPAPSPPRPRPVATPAAFAGFGGALGAIQFPLTPDAAPAYLDAVRADEDLYRGEGLVHPAWLLRAANEILVRNVAMGPWIHVGSHAHHAGLARAGEPLEVRALVTDVREHKGHGFVDLDVVVVDGNRQAIARIDHTAIYAPRQVRGGGGRST